MSLLLPLRGHFECSKHLYFLTLKGPKDIHNKIDFTIKKCKKISKTFVIVREPNKTTPGYHFHALIKATEEPPKRWYSKGVHMNMKRVGKSSINIGMNLNPPIQLYTDKHFAEGHFTSEKYTEVVEQKLMEVFHANHIRLNHVDRLLTYMSKTLDLPMQYTDYYFSNRGKSCKIEGG